MTENQSTKPRMYYSVSEAAELLGWTEDHVWEALETGELAAIALAHWAEPEIFDYRYATPEVVKAVRGANVVEVIWECRGPLGPARFPANPANIRLLAEYVDARRSASISPSSGRLAEPENGAGGAQMQRKAIVQCLGSKYPRLQSALDRGDPWVRDCRVPDKKGWYFHDAVEAACHSRYGPATHPQASDVSIVGQVRSLRK